MIINLHYKFEVARTLPASPTTSLSHSTPIDGLVWKKIIKIGVLYQQCLINYIYKSIIDAEIGVLTAKLVEKNKFMDGPPNPDQLANLTR